MGALGFMNIALFKFLHYDKLYAQARYHVDTLRPDIRNSELLSSIFRPIVIIFFIMIFRMRFSVRRSDGVKANTAARVGGVVALFAAALFVAIATIDCSPGEIAGISDNTHSTIVCNQPCL
ncbi:unnamed protein product [Diatraea saccharalis]|uniref:Uncharacterized protein n=1 Tax=Diatraea saccharalis TaxID=40085 RepID=A0A9N9WHP3_9NEOP|nr:unnamed protein product [Diatraea saccharalis]